MRDKNCQIIFSGNEFLYKIVKIIVTKTEHPWLMFHDSSLKSKISILTDACSNCDIECLHCPACLDFAFIFREFERFVGDVKKLYDDFWNIISSQNLSEEKKSEIMSAYFRRFKDGKPITIVSLGNILGKISSQEIIAKSLISIHSQLLARIDALEINLANYSKSDEEDTILQETSNAYKEEYCISSVSLPENSVVVYFDMNVYDDLEILSYRELIENLKKREYIFVYSPYIIEEILKYHDVEWQNNFIARVSVITNDHVLLKSQKNEEKVIVAIEPPKYSKQRAEVWEKMTEAAQSLEEKKFKIASLEFWKNAPIGYSVPEDLDLYYADNIDNDIGEYINRAYRYANFMSCYQYPQNQQNLSYKEQETFIRNFYKFLNFLQYKREKENATKRIRSSYFDIEHIIYARGADFFITNDNKLNNRARLIFSKISVHTFVCNLRQFFYCTAIEKVKGCFPDIDSGMREAEFNAFCKLHIPQALKDYYLVAGKHPISKEYNIFLPPEKFEVHDGYLWFMEENQTVCHWGIKEHDLKQIDPEVWQLHTDSSGKLSAAYSEDRTVSTFIINYFDFLKVCNDEISDDLASDRKEKE